MTVTGAPGDAVADLVAVMDRLRSPGGCPWDAEQTHASLARYAVEEAFELAEAIEDGDRDDLREELGDLLLQVVFHARLAQEHPDAPFGLDEVAAATAAKLRRRHPHVFAPPAEQGRLSAAEVSERWEDLKRAEGRSSALDGVPVALPALARAQAVLRRAGRIPAAAVRPSVPGLASAPAGGGTDVLRDLADARIDVLRGPAGAGVDVGQVPAGSGGHLGERLLALVAEAEAVGVDAESVLRGTVRELEGALRGLEGQAHESATPDASPGDADGEPRDGA